MSTAKKIHTKVTQQPNWQRLVLLVVLGYETTGAILGGILLIAAPDGRLMNMPVEIMHGFFPRFLIPGIILLGLGILNTLTFIMVLRRFKTDWLMAIFSLGGLAVWFVVEIIVLQELHWLHLMWGFPVYLGIVAAIPLVSKRNPTTLTHKVLLSCGILSSLWYFAINIYVPMQYEGYSVAAFTVSELSAINAPTRILWVLLSLLYPLLFAAFGWGVLRFAAGSRSLRTAGWLIIAYCIFNFYWPPMHMRGTAPTLTDTLHIVWAMITLFSMMLIMGFGAAALSKGFRIYTLLTFAVFIVFGALIGMEASAIPENLPTPHLGIWERINMAAFFLWVMIFSAALMRKKAEKT